MTCASPEIRIGSAKRGGEMKILRILIISLVGAFLFVPAWAEKKPPIPLATVKGGCDD
jgi:hypothetical protein